MTDVQILLTALIAVMHVPIWEDDYDFGFKLGCSCGWQRDSNGRLLSGYSHELRDHATQDWIIHQQESARLTRAAVDLATADA